MIYYSATEAVGEQAAAIRGKKKFLQKDFIAAAGKRVTKFIIRQFRDPNPAKD